MTRKLDAVFNLQIRDQINIKKQVWYTNKKLHPNMKERDYDRTNLGK